MRVIALLNLSELETSVLSSRTSNNFDFIRIAAASFVLIGHSSDVLLNQPLLWDPGKLLFGFSMQSLGVLIFFIISGYLVTSSFENRKSLFIFIISRVLRIFPALIVIVLLSVFVLGTALTTVSMQDYFNSEFTKHYLQNMTLYRMYYYLPGVFETNPIGSSVNASLWTLPYEFTCYLYIALAGMVSLLNSKWVSLTLFVVYFSSYIYFQDEIDRIVIPIIGIDFKTFFIPFLYFLAGSQYYKFRSSISYNFWGLLICGAITVLVKTGYLHHQFLIPVLPYLVLAFAFSKVMKLYHFARYGDFSYGLYLYAFPVQQLIVYFAPVKPDLWMMIFLSFVFTVPFAFFSWHVVEKRALSLKHKFGKTTY